MTSNDELVKAKRIFDHAYLALSLSGFLFPAYEDKVINYTEPVLLAEVAIMLWLIIMGAKEQRLAAAS